MAGFSLRRRKFAPSGVALEASHEAAGMGLVAGFMFGPGSNSLIDLCGNQWIELFRHAYAVNPLTGKPALLSATSAGRMRLPNGLRLLSRTAGSVAISSRITGYTGAYPRRLQTQDDSRFRLARIAADNQVTVHLFGSNVDIPTTAPYYTTGQSVMGLSWDASHPTIKRGLYREGVLVGSSGTAPGSGTEDRYIQLDGGAGEVDWMFFFDRAVDQQALFDDPMALVRARRQVLYFGGDTPPNIAPQSGSVLCAGGVPGVEQSLALAPSAGTVVWAGGVPGISQAHAVQPATGAFAWAGYAPGLAQPHVVSPSAGAALWAGGVPGIVSGRAVAPAAGAVAWGGYAPAVAQPNGVAPTAGAAMWSGSVPGVVSGRAIAPAAGAVAWAGEAPGIAQPRTVAPSAGAVVWAGGVPTVGLANLVEPADGGIVWTGGLPGIAQARAVSPGAGAAAWIGGVPGVEAGWAVRPAGGAARWAGHAPGIGQPRAVAPGAGAARWLGNAPYVGAINLVRPDPGAIVFTGRVPGIAQPRTVSPLPGAVRWAGGMPGIGDLLGRPEAVRAVIRERFILTVAAERRILRS